MTDEAAYNKFTLNSGTFRQRLGRLLVYLWLAILVPGVVSAANQVQNDSQPGAEHRELLLGVYTHIRPTEVIRKFQPFIDYLNLALAQRNSDHRVRLKIYPNYETAIDALAAGDIDIARFGPVSYVMAKQVNPDLRLIAMESNQGSKLFNGVIAVPRSSTITSLEQLNGKRIAFGARRSTTGRYLSQTQLVKAGLTKKDVAEAAYLGRHDKVAFAVGAGAYDAGAMNENTFNKYRVAKGLRKLIEFPCVTKPWIARQGLAPDIYDTIQQILFELTDPEVLKPIKRSGFIAAQDSDYDLIRHAMEGARSFDQQQLKFALYASERPSTLYSELIPLLTSVEAILKNEGYFVQFNIKTYPTYRMAVDALVQNQADLGRFGAASYIMAKRANNRLQILVREASASEPGGVLFSRADSNIKQLSDLKNKRLAFADRYSTEGHYLPMAEISKSSLRADELGEISYLGRHDRVIYTVASGKYDVGAARIDAFRKFQQEKQLQAIAEFSSLERAWLVGENFDPDLRDKLRQTLLTLNNTPAMKNLNLNGFKATDDAYYDPVRLAIEKAALFESR